MGWRVKDRTTNVGFVSTRFAGTDGVSLETHKWATILDGLDFESFYFAGESDTPADRTMVVPEAHFLHPRVVALTERLFGGPTRSAETSREVQQLRDLLKPRLEEFVRTFGIDLLIVENALSLPLNVPLGLALVELIAETGLPTIAHHHDFSWERTRLAIHAAGDYLRAAFPPQLPSLRHVVINSFAARQLALRAGISSVLIPNVMDFDSPPPGPDEVCLRLNASLGLTPMQRLLLQPTRIVPRKRIELALELARRLERIEDERRKILEQSRAQAEKEIEALREELGELKRKLARAAQPLEIVKEVEAALEDARVAAVPLGVAWPELGEQLGDRVAIAQPVVGEAPVGQRRALAERDHPLNDTPQFLRLGQRGRDLLVRQQRVRHVAEHGEPVACGAV